MPPVPRGIHRPSGPRTATDHKAGVAVVVPELAAVRGEGFACASAHDGGGEEEQPRESTRFVMVRMRISVMLRPRPAVATGGNQQSTADFGPYSG